MIARLRKLFRCFDALAFANVGNFTEFRRELALADKSAATGQAARRERALARQERQRADRDPQFAGWMAKWDAMATTAVGRLEALEIENAHLRRQLDRVTRDRDDLAAARARQDRVPGIG